MTKPAAFRATYSDVKLVKTRQVVQAIFEIPLADWDAASVVLGGMPDPAKERWFAIARLNPGAEPINSAASADPQRNQERAIEDVSPSACEKPARIRTEAQRAGYLCTLPSFQRFLYERCQATMIDEAEAIIAVREWCGVKSRSEIDSNPKALDRWRTLTADYDVWQRALV